MTNLSWIYFWILWLAFEDMTHPLIWLTRLP
jgi:hypothetical protein